MGYQRNLNIFILSNLERPWWVSVSSIEEVVAIMLGSLHAKEYQKGCQMTFF